MINKQIQPFKKYCCSSLLSFNPFWVHVRLQIQYWIFLEFHIGPGNFWGFCLKPKGLFWVVIYVPIHTSPSFEIQNTPLDGYRGLTAGHNPVMIQHPIQGGGGAILLAASCYRSSSSLSPGLCATCLEK